MPLPVSRKLVDPCFDKFRAMWMENAFCDALIMAEGDPEAITIKAHRVVLSAFSSVLKHKFLDQPDPSQVIRVKYIDYNGLMFALRLMYEGCVKIPDGDLEGFFQVVRSLAIKTGEPELDTLIYDQDIAAIMSAHPSTAAASSAKPKFQGVLERVSGSHRIIKPESDKSAVSSSQSAQRPPDSSHGSSTEATVRPRVDLRVPPPGLVRPTQSHVFNELHDHTMEQFKINRRPDGTRNVFRPDTNRPAEPPTPGGGLNSGRVFLNRTVPLPVNGGPIGTLGYTQPSADRHNLSLPAMNEPPPPVSRHVFLNPEDNLYWLEARNEVSTGEHAVKDKFGEFGLQRIAGDYEADQCLYLAFNSEAQTLAAMQVLEFEIKLTPVRRPPANIASLWLNPQSGGMSRSGPPPAFSSAAGGPLKRARPTSEALKIFAPHCVNKAAVLRLLRNNGIMLPQTAPLIFDQGYCTIPLGPSDLDSAIRKFSDKRHNGVPLNPERVSLPG
ncbi:hypothetical protein TCAL_09022 [Tigriopus californicus]|uniref:BTB domain-containing protein n=1 Tax=Tigriopus californicus TaxID=6832 RepID=A0A553NB03_TIGCA|nr:uncharacterized protein LOC131887643 [Tigriopus californicus]TRY62559.1 hypothetical protein TCAL_09022 [Tigriopus californicus]|eukprot:TCALIF_09022-PA protein Name:"Similar to fru Sex determination protein fruitless (Drosophila melanogaster)" AED:0.00 eAED:0.00 QI:193/1/1/1/1/1/2/738/496